MTRAWTRTCTASWGKDTCSWCCEELFCWGGFHSEGQLVNWCHTQAVFILAAIFNVVIVYMLICFRHVLVIFILHCRQTENDTCSVSFVQNLLYFSQLLVKIFSLLCPICPHIPQRLGGEARSAVGVGALSYWIPSLVWYGSDGIQSNSTTSSGILPIYNTSTNSVQLTVISKNR